MRSRISLKVFIAIGALVSICACQQSEYTKLEKAELASGLRYDSLFHGIHLGQSKKEFYEICWEKNRQGLFSAGGPNNFVKYEIFVDSTMVNNIEMYFYPDFDNKDNITGMDMEYKYRAWAPWNENLTSAKLLPVLKDTLMKWYGGNEFIEISDNEDPEPIWVKLDGNRRIAIKAKDDERLQVKMVDLTVAK